MSQVVELYLRALDEFDRRMQEVDEDQWANPTPCSEWTVRDLVNHVTAEDLWVPPLLEGKTLEEVGDRFEGDVLGDDPKAAWSKAKEEAASAAEAASLDRSVHTSMGPMPAHTYLGQTFGDHIIHAWDLARGIGGDDRLDAELVAECDRSMRPHAAMIRSSGVFGDHVDPPADADAQTRLLALVGRRA